MFVQLFLFKINWNMVASAREGKYIQTKGLQVEIISFKADNHS